jgi:hypothetical protein
MSASVDMQQNTRKLYRQQEITRIPNISSKWLRFLPKMESLKDGGAESVMLAEVSQDK